MKFLPCVIIATLLPGLAAASETQDNMKAFVVTEVRQTLADPMAIAAIQGSNTLNMAKSSDEILALDGKWRAEVGKGSALIGGISQNSTSAMLRDIVGASGGKITEVILMDAKGLNVAVSDVTSDFWQGDEEKHQMTYGVGPTAVHVSEVELDESTQTYQAQVSFTVVDPATGMAIGAATVGLNAESF